MATLEITITNALFYTKILKLKNMMSLSNLNLLHTGRCPRKKTDSEVVNQQMYLMVYLIDLSCICNGVSYWDSVLMFNVSLY